MKASDKELGGLHLQVARSFSRALEDTATATALLEEHRDELPDAVIAFLERVSDPSPSLLAAAVKFLKDNDITCSISENEAMSDLEKRLQEKRKRSVGNVVALPVED